MESKSSLLVDTLPALKIILKRYGRLRFFQIIHHILMIEDHISTDPVIIWYTKSALVFGWIGQTKRIFLHLFIRDPNPYPFYVQVFSALNDYTFIGYTQIELALIACLAEIE